LNIFRRKRIEEELQAIKDEKSEKMAQKDELRLAEEKRARDIVRQTIAESEHWLTIENMEEKIAEAVDNPLNFNFAISHNGMITKRTALVLPDDHEDYLEKDVKAV